MAEQLRVGIDFGTSTTLVAIRRNRGIPQIIPIGKTRQWMPSVWSSHDGKVVGEDAEGRHPYVVRSVKRCITENQSFVMDQSGASYPADPIIEALLAETRDRLLRQHDEADEMTVRFGCPAMWDGPQRERLVNAARNVGFQTEVSSLIDEPIAAGITWIREQEEATGKVPKGLCLVFDAGGGTLDIAVLDCERGRGPGEAEISVLAAGGSAQAGDWIDSEFSQVLAEKSTSMADAPRGWQLLIARNVKEELTTRTEYRSIQSIGSGKVDVEASRSDLSEVLDRYIAHALGLCAAVLREAKLRRSGESDTQNPTELRRQVPSFLFGEVRHVVVCGGASASPFIVEQLAEVFASARVSIQSASRLQTMVAEGLTLDDRVERLNLHRPAFNLILKRGGEETLVYKAFTPLYSREEVMRGQSDLGATFDVSNMRGKWELHCSDADGAPVRFRPDDGEPQDWLPVELDRRSVFKLYTTGKLVVGKREPYRIEKWPVFRGSGPTPSRADLRISIKTPPHHGYPYG